MVRNGQLVMTWPNQLDPLPSLLTLIPAGRHRFRLEGTGYEAMGEIVQFDVDAKGEVTRMRIGAGYTEKVR